ncbi:hypothetical protein GCM10027347_61630 [Larkinella harenae]
MAQVRTTKEDVQAITGGVLFNKAAKSHVNKDIEIPSVEGKQKFRVYGRGIDRKTWIFIYPHQVEEKREKYRVLGQSLHGPLSEDDEEAK